ncbi:pyridoxal phosphate-dependent decarboxylase family protein [Nocardia harenae]|uniref:pyridoxal phosphate-dependent decarboxylase family protein n=1 Tax=Nocardia harenae TaxID=358707 RepID=UPI000B17CF13|nr:pyridoxal-dependent decarboxylase [Nocardia harenae]
MNISETSNLLHRALDLGLEFKTRPAIFGRRESAEAIRDLLLTDLPTAPTDADAVLDDFHERILPLCKNEASPRFLGFGDTGDDPLALAGSLLATLTQQNLINQSFDSPSATFIDIAVLRWLRDFLGYRNPAVGEVRTVWDVGGMITPGGTTSNTVAMLLAREAKAPGTMQSGVSDPGRFAIVVPEGIGHYSVRAALTWIGCGAQIIEVPTAGFRYDRAELARALRRHRDRAMAVVAYAGDSRTQTVDDLRAIHDLVRAIDPTIWLHADACWGLLAAFTPTLRGKIDGIADFDSITVDPHKILAVPYSSSALLVRDPAVIRSISTYSDLIMQEDFAFGQITPFLGTREWTSLKLWMMVRGRGRDGLAQLAERRCESARRFAELVDAHPRLVRLNDPDLSAVVFAHLPIGIEAGQVDRRALDRINDLNLAIHARMLSEGRWHLHQFTMRDDLGRLYGGATVHPLRFMAGNPATTETHMHELLTYLTVLVREIEGDDA